MTVPIPVEAHAGYLTNTLLLEDSPGVQDAVRRALQPAFPNPRPKTLDLWDIGSHDKQIGTLKMAQSPPVYVVSVSGLALMFRLAQGCLGNLWEVFRHRPYRSANSDSRLDADDGSRWL